MAPKSEDLSEADCSVPKLHHKEGPSSSSSLTPLSVAGIFEFLLLIKALRSLHMARSSVRNIPLHLYNEQGSLHVNVRIRGISKTLVRSGLCVNLDKQESCSTQLGNHNIFYLSGRCEKYNFYSVAHNNLK